MSFKKKAVLGVAAAAVALTAVSGAAGDYVGGVLDSIADGFNQEAQLTDMADKCVLKLDNGKVAAAEFQGLILKAERDGFDTVDQSQAVFVDGKGQLITTDATSMSVGGNDVIDHMTSYNAKHALEEVGDSYVMIGGNEALIKDLGGEEPVVFSDIELPSTVADLEFAGGYSSNQSPMEYLSAHANNYMDRIQDVCLNGAVIKADAANFDKNDLTVMVDLERAGQGVQAAMKHTNAAPSPSQ